MLTAESFRPAPYLRNGHLQTILASSSLSFNSDILSEKMDPVAEKKAEAVSRNL
jgi:hypothetical protein